MIQIKIFIIIAIFSLFVNLSYDFFLNSDYLVFLKSYNTNVITNDSYLGVFFDLFVKIIFNIDFKNLSEGLRMFGIK